MGQMSCNLGSLGDGVRQLSVGERMNLVAPPILRRMWQEPSFRMHGGHPSTVFDLSLYQRNTWVFRRLASHLDRVESDAIRLDIAVEVDRLAIDVAKYLWPSIVRFGGPSGLLYQACALEIGKDGVPAYCETAIARFAGAARNAAAEKYTYAPGVSPLAGELRTFLKMLAAASSRSEVFSCWTGTTKQVQQALLTASEAEPQIAIFQSLRPNKAALKQAGDRAIIAASRPGAKCSDPLDLLLRYLIDVFDQFSSKPLYTNFSDSPQGPGLELLLLILDRYGLRMRKRQRFTRDALRKRILRMA